MSGRRPHDKSIERAELAFESPRWAKDPRAVMFALGYAIGLSATGLYDCVMQEDWGHRTITFNPMERNALHMVYRHRNPGNLEPDRDPAFAPAAAAGGLEVRGDRRP